MTLSELISALQQMQEESRDLRGVHDPELYFYDGNPETLTAVQFEAVSYGLADVENGGVEVFITLKVENLKAKLDMLKDALLAQAEVGGHA